MVVLDLSNPAILDFGGYFFLGFLAGGILIYSFTRKLYLSIVVGLAMGVLFFYGAGYYEHFMTQVRQLPAPPESSQ
jgi:hypothetical protein